MLKKTAIFFLHSRGRNARQKKESYIDCPLLLFSVNLFKRFLINTGANVAAGLIQAKMQGLF